MAWGVSKSLNGSKPTQNSGCKGLKHTYHLGRPCVSPESVLEFEPIDSELTGCLLPSFLVDTFPRFVLTDLKANRS